MRILVEGIPAAGREVPVHLREVWARAAADAALDRAVETLEGCIGLMRASARVISVHVAAVAKASGSCDRCGDACPLVVEVDQRLLFAPIDSEGEDFDGGEIQLEAADLDSGWYEDGGLMLEDVLREALALAVPARLTCADTPECDKRTDALLSSTRTSGGSFAGLAGFTARSTRKE